MPCFDYCISLLVYVNKYLIKKLCKIYYFTLYRLFKIDVEGLPNETINKILKLYGLSSFHHRLISRIFVFTAKVGSETNSPVELKRDISLTELNNEFYNLRSNKTSTVLPNFSSTKFGGLMFKNKFGNLINNFKSLDFFSDLKIFKESLYKNLDEFVKNL